MTPGCHTPLSEEELLDYWIHATPANEADGIEEVLPDSPLPLNDEQAAALEVVLASLQLPAAESRSPILLHGVTGSGKTEVYLQAARHTLDLGKTGDGKQPAIRGYVQANAEHLPLRGDSLDCVVCIRFMMHVDPATRVRMLREFHRVSRRWVVVDYRHKYTFRYLLSHTFGKLGLGRSPMSRVSRKDLEQEFRDAGFAIREVVRVSAPLLSDKWVVLAERA